MMVRVRVDPRGRYVVESRPSDRVQWLEWGTWWSKDAAVSVAEGLAGENDLAKRGEEFRKSIVWTDEGDDA